MKFIYTAILAGLLAGCATAPTEYNQGCKDALDQFENQIKDAGFRGYDHPENIEPYCKALETKRNNTLKDLMRRP